jgi:hypothetical protein
VLALREAARLTAITLALLTALPVHATQPLVDVLWLADSPHDDRFRIAVGNRQFVVRDPAEHARRALETAFESVARSVEPPWPLKVVVRKFVLYRTGDGVHVALTVTVADARDNWPLHRGPGEGEARLAPDITAEQFAAALVQAFAIAAREAAAGFAARQSLKQGRMVPRWPLALGVELTAPPHATLRLRTRIRPGDEVELGVNPGFPSMLARAGWVRTLLRRDGLGAETGLGAVVEWAPPWTVSCDLRTCPDRADVATYMEGRFGLQFWLGDDERHGLTLSVGARAGFVWLPNVRLDGTGVLGLGYLFAL